MGSAGEITPEAFIEHWSKAEASERANAQAFLIGLAKLLGVPEPSNSHADGYSFEFPVKIPTGPGVFVDGRMDLYRRGCFVLESKQFQESKPEPTQLELAAEEAGVIGKKKSSQPVRGTGAWDDAMTKARGQAERYVRALPGDEPTPPFLIVVDVGHTFELFADFSQAGKAYLPFPDPRTFRIRLADLADEKIRERLRLVWTESRRARSRARLRRCHPRSLRAPRRACQIAGTEPDTRPTSSRNSSHAACSACSPRMSSCCQITPSRELLASLPPDGTGFQEVMGQLFREMNTGTGKGISVVLRKNLLHFNGGLFASDTVLPVNGLQLGLLKEAARQNWGNVEPAIFGTLLERALNPDERHELGAHFTPRAYVERLVLPTVIEPLRAEWENVRAAAVTHARAGRLREARDAVNAFHAKLCALKVLDPACGTGNFLYVSLQQLKVLEGEVLDLAAQFGENFKLELETHTVDPHQFLGLEINPRAAAIAELVLWIGYLQWHFRLHGKRTPPEPILRAFKNIECRDAVLAYDGEPQPARDEAGKEITVWDRKSTKTDMVTGRKVPDETKRVPLLTYANPRPATWPDADFIVGNPPFIGTARMREDLGDGYAETLRATYPAVPESADFVLYWWHKAAELMRAGRAKRFGLITTNSLRQTFARRVVQMHLTGSESPEGLRKLAGGVSHRIPRKTGRAPAGVPEDSPAPAGADATGGAESGGSRFASPPANFHQPSGLPLSLLFAIPDHPWVDTAEGAAVRIAMTVGAAGEHPGELLEVTGEEPQDDGSEKVSFKSNIGKISADLTVGADVSSVVALKANDGLACPGVKLHGAGFLVTPEESKELGLGKILGLEKHIRYYRNGKDLTDAPRGVMVIDLFGLSADEVRQRFPAIYQLVVNRVKPERDANNRATYRDNWWIFGEPRRDFRPALDKLVRYIATVETAKHRFFQFLDGDVLPDNMVIAIALDDAFYLGVLSSRIHIVYALAAGGTLEDRPRYNKSRCFDPFPFPLCGEAEKERIRKLAEELDAHRKRVQAQHGLTLTGLYNVLEKIRDAENIGGTSSTSPHSSPAAETSGTRGTRPSDTLTDKEKAIHDKGLVSVLKQLHDDLDAAVFAAYGWPATLTDAEILERLVALNAERAAEEKRGVIHWLRPDYQTRNAQRGTRSEQAALDLPESPAKNSKLQTPKSKMLWPKPLAERIRATETALHAAGRSVTAADLSKCFARARTADIAEILETLATLGRAQRHGDQFTR